LATDALARAQMRACLAGQTLYTGGSLHLYRTAQTLVAGPQGKMAQPMKCALT